LPKAARRSGSTAIPCSSRSRDDALGHEPRRQHSEEGLAHQVSATRRRRARPARRSPSGSPSAARKE
jgi:hypothetical protein